MKSLKEFILFILIGTFSNVPLSAFAAGGSSGGGGQDGGGGGVIRCEKSDLIELQYKVVDGERILVRVPPKSALPNNRDFELIDLWEAENGYGPFVNHRLSIPYDNETPKEVLIERAFLKLEKVSPQLAKRIREFHQYVIKRMIPIKDGEYVIPPDDTDIRFLPIGCRPLGFGAYSDRADNLVYDPKIMAGVPMIDRAAFEVHEAVYKYFRSIRKNSQGSWDSRRFVGLMFSTEPFTLNELIKGFAKK